MAQEVRTFDVGPLPSSEVEAAAAVEKWLQINKSGEGWSFQRLWRPDKQGPTLAQCGRPSPSNLAQGKGSIQPSAALLPVLEPLANSSPSSLGIRVGSSEALKETALTHVKEPVAELVSVALDRCPDNSSELVAALLRAPEAHRDAVAFLVACMPVHDLASLKAEFLLETARLAYKARSQMAWGSAVPDRLFLEYVLPYAQANEKRENWRPMLLDLFGPQVQGFGTVEEAIAFLNREVFQQLGVSYHATKRPKPDMSPSESIEVGFASCTGLSILLADACRAVAIPARLASVPLWSDRSGNHTWLEVWIPAPGGGGKWRYIGASEQGPLDQTWFSQKCKSADGSHPYTCIYALSFRPTGILFPCVWLPDHDFLFASDVTARYVGPDTAAVEADEVAVTWWDSVHRPLNRLSAVESHLESSVRRLVAKAWPILDKNSDNVLDGSEVAALAMIFFPPDAADAAAQQALALFGEGLRLNQDAFVRYLMVVQLRDLLQQLAVSPLRMTLDVEQKVKDYIDGKLVEALASQPKVRPRVAAFSFSPRGGRHQCGVLVEIRIQPAELGAEVFFTADGGEPTRDSERYVEPMLVERSTRLRAAAFLPGDSPPAAVASAFFEIAPCKPEGVCSAPTLQVNDLTWQQLLSDQEVCLEQSQVTATRASLWSKYRDAVVSDPARLAEMYMNKAVCTAKGKAMRFTFEIVGDKPQGGYPLYIGLHGGGGCPATTNDEQWRQMQTYYCRSVDVGIYVAPRGCQDTWDLHWCGDSFSLYDRLIENMIAFLNVDPDRVYILGFSAGGDGVYQLAPRLADRLAGANMSAGHPNGVSVHNLYHVPFLIQVGEKDGAYNRNKQAVAYGKKLEERACKYPGGYISECWVHRGMPHNFMDHDERGRCEGVLCGRGCERSEVRCNTNAVHWLSMHARDPAPRHLIWDVATQASRPRPPGAVGEGLEGPVAARHRFYWLDRSGLEPYDAARIEVRCEPGNNRVEVLSSGSWLRVLLDRRLVDFERVVVIEGVGFHFEFRVRPSLVTMTRTMLERGDPLLMFEAEVTLHWDDGGCHASCPCGELMLERTGPETEPVKRALSQLV